MIFPKTVSKKPYSQYNIFNPSPEDRAKAKAEAQAQASKVTKIEFRTPIEKTYNIGYSKVTTIISGVRRWEKGEYVRLYYDIKTVGKAAKALDSLYQVVSGRHNPKYREQYIEIDNKVFVYIGGISATNSTRKREHFHRIVTEIVEEIIKQESFN